MYMYNVYNYFCLCLLIPGVVDPLNLENMSNLVILGHK